MPNVRQKKFENDQSSVLKKLASEVNSELFFLIVILWFFFDSMIKMLALQSVQLVTGIDICKYKSAAKEHKISILPCPYLLLNLIPF